MKYGRIRTRLVASALATVLAPAVPVTAMVAGLSPAMARAADLDHADCQVHAVLASNEGDKGIPKELEFLAAQLREDEFAAYKEFHLIEQKETRISLDKVAEVKFRSGNRIGLSLLGNDDKRLKIQIALSGRDGQKQLLSSQLSFNDGAVVMVRAGDYEVDGKKGKLFLPSTS